MRILNSLIVLKNLKEWTFWNFLISILFQNINKIDGNPLETFKKQKRTRHKSVPKGRGFSITCSIEMNITKPRKGRKTQCAEKC